MRWQKSGRLSWWPRSWGSLPHAPLPSALRPGLMRKLSLYSLLKHCQVPSIKMKQKDRKGGQIYELLSFTGSASTEREPQSHFPPKPFPSHSSQTLAAHVSYQATAPFQPWAPPRESGSTNPGVSPRFCSPFLFHGLEGPRTLPHLCAAYPQTHYLPSKPLPPHPKVFS